MSRLLPAINYGDWYKTKGSNDENPGEKTLMSTPFHINKGSLDQTPGVQKEVDDLPWYYCASLV